MNHEEITVTVPEEGLVVQLEPGRFTRHHAVHPRTAMPDAVVRVIEGTINSFKIIVELKPPPTRQRTIIEEADEEGVIRRMPRFGLIEVAPMRVKAEVTYYITGE